MRGILFVCLCMVLSVTTSLDPKWKLVFSDEFDGTTLDLSKWNIKDQAGTNHELQYYAPQQVSVSGGNLVITANNIPFNGKAYMSGCVDTQNKFSTTFGRFEFRAQMPTGFAMWPEVKLLAPSTFILINSPINTPTEFHVYAFEWSGDAITWFVDDVMGQTFPRTNTEGTFKVPSYISIYSSIGGGYGGLYTPAVFPNYMNIDYIRVYKDSATCADISCSNGCCDPGTLMCVCNAGWSGASCSQSTSLSPSSVELSSESLSFHPAAEVCAACRVVYPTGTGTGLEGYYYDGNNNPQYFVNFRFSRVDPQIYFSWTGSPDPRVASQFSIRWRGKVQPKYSDLYTFTTYNYHGIRLWVDNTLVINSWQTQTLQYHYGTPINLIAGQKYDIVLEYFDTSSTCVINLYWSNSCEAQQIIPQSQLYTP